MDKDDKDPDTIDLDAPRHTQYMHKAWKKQQNTVYWVDIKLAQKKGLKLCQTRSNAIILYNTLPACCIPKAVRMETGELKNEKVYESPWPPPKISLRNDWMKELGSEVARQAEDNQPTQPNPNPIERTGRPVVTEQTSRSSAQEIDTRFSLDCKNTNLFVERVEKDKDTDKHVDADRDETGRPITQLEEVDIDFRVSGLPHAVVKQAENSRVRELVKKIESHPHRQDLQADLQQSNTYNPFSEKSKKMIQDICNVELFELRETIPKVQCLEYLLCWNQGIVYCTCGHLLRESSRGILRWTWDLLSIQNYVIKKERPHGNRHWKTEEQIKHHVAHNLKKRCIKRGFKGIHDRFQNDPTLRESLLSIDRTEEVCIQMDKDAQRDFTYRMSQDEYFRYKRIGGSLSTHLAEMHRWNSDQTSAKH